MENNQQPQIRKNIAILGAGFGGVTCALRLEKLMRKKKSLFKEYNIALVDKNNYHLYAPALYEVATTATDDASPINLKKAVATPLEEIVKGKMIRFLQGKIIKIDLASKTIFFEDHTSFQYEYLVFALGAEPAYFGIPGLKENSIPLKWLENGIEIRSKIRQKFGDKKSGDSFNVIVGGGGPNGIEFSTELIGYLRRLSRQSGKKINCKVTIIEGAPNILPGFDNKVIAKATKRLNAFGIETKAGFVISRVNENSAQINKVQPVNPVRKDVALDQTILSVKNFINSPSKPPKWVEPSNGVNSPTGNVHTLAQDLPFDVLIWSGGVEANNLLRLTALKQEKRGRAEVDPYLACVSPDQHLDIGSKIFAIGDNACFYDPVSNRPIPGTARIAIEQAKIAAENIFRDLTEKPKIKYRCKTYPFAIPIGGKYAICKFGSLTISGFPGWIFKQLIELYYLFSITDDWAAFWRWARGVGIFVKND